MTDNNDEDDEHRDKQAIVGGTSTVEKVQKSLEGEDDEDDD